MSIDKVTLSKLLDFIAEIAAKPENAWFRLEIVKRFKIEDTDAIDEIYEYCIRKILQDQAERFYDDFILEKIKPQLIEDFIRMEKFKREGNFGDFSLAVYQQLESIINKLADQPELKAFLKNNWNLPSLKKYNDISQRDENSKLLSGLINFEKEKINPDEIQKWFVNQKTRAVLYYYYFDENLTSPRLFTNLNNKFNEIYQCRNLNHRGSEPNEYQQRILDNILPNKNKYYFRFQGFLEDFVTTVTQNCISKVIKEG